VTNILQNGKLLLLILLSMSCVLSSNIIVVYGKEISFRTDDKFSSDLKAELKENRIFFKYQPYGFFTVEIKNAESFISVALSINDKIFGSSGKPIPYDDMQLNRSGYMNKRGRIVIEPKYIVARPYGDHNIAAVADEREWKYIDIKGKTILKPYLFDNGPDYFKDGLSRYIENNRIGFIDEKYQIAIKAQYEFVTPFSNSYATFCVGCKDVLLKEGVEQTKREGGRWGIIDKKGKVVVEPIYDKPIVFEENKAKVTLNNQTWYIDEFGDRIE
jgi:hypothetical protein